MKLISIEAREVKPGDFIYNSHGYCESAKWVRVTDVVSYRGSPYPGTTNPRMYVVIQTRLFDTWKDPREGVAVRRTEA